MMSLFCSGELVRDPERRTSAKGAPYAVGLLKVGEDLVNVTAFDTALVERLADLRKGDPLSVSGKCQVSAYLDKQGQPKAGLQVTVTELMTAPARAVQAKPRARPKPGTGRNAVAAVEQPFDDEIRF